MDPLSHIVTLLRPHAVLSKPITGRGNWGVSYARYEAPSFCIVLSGRCWLTIENMAPRLLDRGDFLLLPVTPAFSLVSHPGASCRPGLPSETAVRHGDPEGEPDFQMLGGAFKIEPVNATLLLGLLPGMIHIRSLEGDTSRLARIIDLIKDECADERQGRTLILDRLLEVMLIESLRWHTTSQEAIPAGLLAGMRDPAIAGALRAMHSDARHGWTVAELAKLAGKSRSAFAALFAETVGCGPMEYLSRWRMSLAMDALCHGAVSLDRLADEIGYKSASAFSTAFRKRMGRPPGEFARASRQAEIVVGKPGQRPERRSQA
jgi:AraC-like DNA-binding protein